MLLPNDSGPELYPSLSPRLHSVVQPHKEVIAAIDGWTESSVRSCPLYWSGGLEFGVEFGA